MYRCSRRYTIEPFGRGIGPAQYLGPNPTLTLVGLPQQARISRVNWAALWQPSSQRRLRSSRNASVRRATTRRARSGKEPAPSQCRTVARCIPRRRAIPRRDTPCSSPIVRWKDRQRLSGLGRPSCACVPEGFAQCVHLGSRKALHHFRVACQHVEAVEGPWDDEQFGRDARVDQTASIFDVLIDEEIERADADESRRETLKLCSSRGNSGGGYVCPTRIGAEEGAPAEAIGLGRPDQFADVRGYDARAAGPVVEHGVDQRLEQDRHLAAVA